MELSILSAGDYTCCDLVVQIKECKDEASAAPEPEPAPPEPAPPEPVPFEGPETPDLQEDCSECQQAPAGSALTLQVRTSACLVLIPANVRNSEGETFPGESRVT